MKGQAKKYDGVRRASDRMLPLERLSWPGGDGWNKGGPFEELQVELEGFASNTRTLLSPWHGAVLGEQGQCEVCGLSERAAAGGRFPLLSGPGGVLLGR